VEVGAEGYDGGAEPGRTRVSTSPVSGWGSSVPAPAASRPSPRSRSSGNPLEP